VNLSIFELVFFLGVKNKAVFVEKTHDGGLPPRAPQEINDDIEKPVLNLYKKGNNVTYIF
jgi:hypothetical protein